MWNYFLTSCVIVLVSLFYNCYFSSPVSVIRHPNNQYDYVIVGAGTAGCVLASRLSRRSNVTVLLIEAGGYFSWWSAIPLTAPLVQKSHMDWQYETESQLFSSIGLINNKQCCPRGKGLGGSGQMNYLVHSFGTPNDYDSWPRGWSHADLVPYFNRVSTTMNVVLASRDDPLAKALAVAEASLRADNITLQRASNTCKNGARWTTYHAYLREALNRKNMHLLMDTLVTKINVVNSKVNGIEVLYKDGIHDKIGVRKELILSAGTFNTPQLLMVSGIGPSEELEKQNITVIKNLSDVGKNLFDHFFMPVYVNLDVEKSITLDKMLSIQEIIKYFTVGKGILSTNGVVGFGQDTNSGFLLFALGTADEKLLKNLANYKTKVFRSMFPSHNDSSHEGFIFLATCLKPKSRGSVSLKTDDIQDPPKIDPAYLSYYDDVLCTHTAIKLAIRTINTELFRKYGANMHHPDFKECRHLRKDYRDIDYTECVLRVGALTSHHPGGTCRMGMDTNSVVDERLRVRGIRRLRIVDASVLPSPISGTPNSVVVAIAERASDLLIDEMNQNS